MPFLWDDDNHLMPAVAHPGCESSGDANANEPPDEFTPARRARVWSRIRAEIEDLEEVEDLAEWERELWQWERAQKREQRRLRCWRVQLVVWTGLAVALWVVLLVTARALGKG